MEVNAHEIDFMRFVMGDAESVSAAGGQFVQMETDFPDVALVSIRFKNGGVGVLHSSQASAIGGYGGRLDCAEGSVVFPTFWGGEGGLRYKRYDGDETAIAASELSQDESPVSQEIRAFCEAPGSPGFHLATTPMRQSPFHHHRIACSANHLHRPKT